MASMKAEKPVGSQLFGQTKKEPAKLGENAESKPPASKQATKQAPKKAEQKPREPKKKAKGGKPGAKN